MKTQNKIEIDYSVSQLERVRVELADKPPIYQEFFLPAAQMIFNQYLNDYELVDLLIAAEEKYPEDYPQFRFDLSRTTRKSESRLRDLVGCIGAAKHFDWFEPGLTTGHHEVVWLKALPDTDKKILLTDANNEDMTVDELEDHRDKHLEKIGKGRKPREPREQTAMEEIQEALDAAQTRVAEAEGLLKRALGFIETEGSGEEEIIGEIKEWLLAS